MKIVTRPDQTLTIQLREFKRKKGGTRGGRMELSKSRTITVHDISLDEVHAQILPILEELEKQTKTRRRG
jgi:hypothetical protein